MIGLLDGAKEEIRGIELMVWFSYFERIWRGVQLLLYGNRLWKRISRTG